MNRYVVAMLAVAPALSAFAQAQSPDPAIVRRVAMIEQTADEVQRLGENFDIVSESQSKLEAKVAKLEGELASISDLRAEIAGLRAENEKLRAQQAELREQIVDDITKRLAKMNFGAAPTPPSPPAPRPISTAARNATPPPDPVQTTSGYNHVVEAGQTLSEIARGYGTTVRAIKQANALKSDNLRIGQKLFIPDPPRK